MDLSAAVCLLSLAFRKFWVWAEEADLGQKVKMVPQIVIDLVKLGFKHESLKWDMWYLTEVNNVTLCETIYKIALHLKNKAN